MITLTIKRVDGSTYWVDHFNTQDECDKWLAEEQTRSYWDKSYVSTSSVDTPNPAMALAEAERVQAIANQATRLNAIKAIISAAPGSLTDVQRDAILIHLVKQQLGK
jgi:hypothetical protein